MLAIRFILVLPDFLILSRVLVLLSLHLVTDQSARAQTQTAAYRCADAWVANCGTDESTRNGTSNSTDPGALFTGRYRPSCATGDRQRGDE